MGGAASGAEAAAADQPEPLSATRAGTSVERQPVMVNETSFEDPLVPQLFVA